MDTNNLSKQLAGIAGSLLVTIILAAGFATATQSQTISDHHVAQQLASEMITVTATRLIGNRSIVVKSTVACKTSSC